MTTHDKLVTFELRESRGASPGPVVRAGGGGSTQRLHRQFVQVSFNREQPGGASLSTRKQYMKAVFQRILGLHIFRGGELRICSEAEFRFCCLLWRLLSLNRGNIAND